MSRPLITSIYIKGLRDALNSMADTAMTLKASTFTRNHAVVFERCLCDVLLGCPCCVYHLLAKAALGDPRCLVRFPGPYQSAKSKNSSDNTIKILQTNVKY